MNKSVVIAICGVKNSGKTTLIEKLLKELTKQKIKTAVVKHDGHDFCGDVPGTDSWRFSQAGAYGAAVYSSHRMLVHKEEKDISAEAIFEMFPEAELILLEGGKESDYPKIELVRKGVSKEPISNSEGRFLLVTDYLPEQFSEPSLSFDSVELIVKRMLEVLTLQNDKGVLKCKKKTLKQVKK